MEKDTKKRKYTVTLDEAVVKKAKAKSLGAKLSPIINELLKIWADEREAIEKLITENQEDPKN